MRLKKGAVVCYASPTPFTDKQGNSVTSGQLAKCSAVGNIAPCVVSTAVSGGNLVIDLLVPPGDPRFWHPPALSNFAPTSGVVGTKVTINGGPYKDVTEVEFDGVPTQFKAKGSGTTITAVVPAGAKTGPITIVTGNGEVISSSDFTVTKKKK
jgi:hypothetical protein